MTPIKCSSILLVNPAEPEYRIGNSDAYSDILPYLQSALDQRPESQNIQLKITVDGASKDAAFETQNSDNLPQVQEVFNNSISKPLTVKHNTKMGQINHRVITLKKDKDKLHLHYVTLGGFNSFPRAIEILARIYPEVGATNEKGIPVLKQLLNRCIESAGQNKQARDTGAQLFQFLLKEINLDTAATFAEEHTLPALAAKVEGERALQKQIADGSKFSPEITGLVSRYLPITK